MKKYTSKKSFSSLLRYNSAFFKTFLGVLLVVIILLGAFSVYTLQLENRNLQENTENSYLNILKTTSTAAERTLQNMQQLMKQTIWSKDFTNAIINPTSDDYTRTTAIITELNEIAKDYPYINKAFLYIPTTESVYSSDLSYLPASNSPDPLFADTDKLLSTSMPSLNISGESLFILNTDQRLFLCQHLYPYYVDTVGILIFELNLPILDLAINQDGYLYTDTCYVFDSAGHPLFAETAPEEIQHQAVSLSSVENSRSEGLLEPAGNHLYLYYRSSLSSWLYLYPVDSQSFYSFLSLNRIMSFGVIVILLALLFSFQIAFRANRPIRNLMNELPTGHLDDIDAKDEIDYLTQAYHVTTAQNQELHQAIQSITPLALERLFNEILSERAPMSENIDATLSSLGHPIPAGARFMAMNLEVSGKTGAELSALEMNLHMLQLKSSILQTLPDGYSAYLLPRESPFIAVILVLPPEADEAAIQELTIALCRKLDSLKLTTPYQLQIGCGNIHSRMKDVRYSYLEAQKNLNHQRFYGSDENTGAPELLPSQNVYFDETRQAIRCIQNNRSEEAFVLTSSIADRIAMDHPEPQDALTEYMIFLSALLEITDALRLGSTEELSERRETLKETLQQLSDTAAMNIQVKAFCSDAIRSIEHRNRTKASQHITRIQEYIHANYSNSSLSLYMAAEQVGISPSYLSRLFKQEMGASFVDYINSVRVDKAMSLLESSDLKIKDIAFQTGFNSMQNFFRIFKKHTGIAPGEYRQNRTGN